MVLDGNSSQEYPVNAGVPQGSISKALLMTHLPADVICNIGVYADKTTLYSKCDQVSTLWQQLEMATELESDLRDIVNRGRKWLLGFNAGKFNLFSLTGLKIMVQIVKIMLPRFANDKTKSFLTGVVRLEILWQN